MKKLYFLLLICSALVSKGFSQAFVWTDPIPVSDSLSDNVNFNMPPLFGSSSEGLFGVWEKQINASTTAIYGRDMLGMTPPFLMLFQPNVIFRHPVVENYLNGDTILAVIYETNMNGNWDIYCSKYLSNGTMAPPVPVVNSPADEENLRYSPNMGIVWEQNGAVMFRNFIVGFATTGLTTVILDQGDCHHPSISSGYCEWEKVSGTDTVVMYAMYQSATSSWTSPQQLVGGINRNISNMDDYGSMIMWQARAGSDWRIKFADLYTPTFYTVNDFQGANNIEPAMINVMLVTKGKFPYLPSFLSFASDVSGSYEIYVNQAFFDTIYTNISNHPGMNHHPQFFSTFVYNYGYMTVFLTWESWRNNHWQIWMTHIDIPEGITEKNALGSLNLKNFPNPFNQSTTITYECTDAGSSSIAIYDIIGEKICILKEGLDQPGKHSLVWDGKDGNGNSVSPGIYICSLRINNQVSQRKITVR